MTSQDALISYFVEMSGITSPTLVAERLGVPVETARKWMRRYRTMRSISTGQISPVGDIDRSNQPKPVKSDRSDRPMNDVPRARISYTEEKKNPIVPSNPQPLLIAAPDGADCDLDDRFAEWWEAYPRKRRVARGKCHKKFSEIVTKTTVTADELIEALKELRGFGNDPDFDVNPHRWLNEERWESERPSNRKGDKLRKPSGPTLEEMYRFDEVGHAH